MHAVVLLNINQHTTFEVPNFTDSKDITGGQNKKRVTTHVTLTTPTMGQFLDPRLTLEIFHLHKNFSDS